MSTEYYILDDEQQPQPCGDVLAWAQWLEEHRRALVIAQTHFTIERGAAPSRSEPLPGMLGGLLALDEYTARITHDVRRLPSDDGELVFVSTRFLGVDMRLLPMGDAPLLFETRVFGGPLDREQDRYCTRAEAIAGHEAMCARVRPFVRHPEARP